MAPSTKRTLANRRRLQHINPARDDEQAAPQQQQDEHDPFINTAPSTSSAQRQAELQQLYRQFSIAPPLPAQESIAAPPSTPQRRLPQSLQATPSRIFTPHDTLRLPLGTPRTLQRSSSRVRREQEQGTPTRRRRPRQPEQQSPIYISTQERPAVQVIIDIPAPGDTAQVQLEQQFRLLRTRSPVQSPAASPFQISSVPLSLTRLPILQDERDDTNAEPLEEADADDVDAAESEAYYYSHMQFIVRRRPWRPSALIACGPLPQGVDMRNIFGRMSISCSYCGALHWIEERIGNSSRLNPTLPCCSQGNVRLAPPAEYPAELMRLLHDTYIRNGRVRRTPRCEQVQQKIRHINNSFSFCSLGANIDQRLANGSRGTYTFRAHGNLYHRIPSLHPPEGAQPAFAQLYIFDGEDEQLQRRGAAFCNIPSSISQIVQGVLHRCNPYIQYLVTNAQRIREDSTAHVTFQILDAQGRDPRRYNRPTVSEVAALIPDFGVNDGRQITLQNRRGGLDFISEYLPSYQPLRYPLLFPYGDQGWHSNIPLHGHAFSANNTLRADEDSEPEAPELLEGDEEEGFQHRRGRGRHGSRRVSQLQWFQHMVQVRAPLSALHFTGRLFHEWLVDGFAAVEANRLNFHRNNQEQYRTAVYSGMVDALSHNDNVSAGDVGIPIVLPATHMGSPRQMRNAYLDAMAIVRRFGSPDYFITMTCNARWTEIVRELKPGQSAQDRPELQNRVFKLKLKELLHELLSVGVLGRAVAHCYVIEFQKRGLPHAHILIILHPDHRPRTIEEIDARIRADIPDREIEPLLHAVITDFMLHSPCGSANPGAACMRDGRCRFHFPFDFQEETVLPDDGYPVHRRPDGNVRFFKPNNAYAFSSRDVAPYNPYLLVRFNAHINVQYVAGFASVKYIYKYVFKGVDRAMLSVGFVQNQAQLNQGLQPPVDEIRQYLDSRYVTAHEAAWRIASQRTHGRSPPVMLLAVHLEGEQPVTVRAEQSVAEVLARDSTRRTTLTEYFEMNRQYKANIARGVRPALDISAIHYDDFPASFRWKIKAKRWQLRKSGFQLGRIAYVSPTRRELYHLRLLLTQIPGHTSYEDARTVNGVVHPTYQAACFALGLLINDAEYESTLEEAANTQTGRALRELFVLILTECQPSSPLGLWEKFRDSLSDNCAYRLRETFSIANPTVEQRYDLALCYIQQSLQRRGKALADFQLPEPARDYLALETGEANPLIRSERIFDADAEHSYFEENAATINEDQRSAFEQLSAALERRQGGVFFVDGPGGTGKTFLQKLLLAKVRSQGKIALAVASTGIAATLLPGGTTAHSRFKIPLDVGELDYCKIAKRTNLAALLRSTELVFWDEAVILHRHAVEAVERTFRDIRGNDLPFGGAIVCFCGDFRQTLPIVKKGSRAQIVAACLKKSPLWRCVTTLPLRINMRLNRVDIDDIERAEIASFSTRLLRVGEFTGADGCTQWNVQDIVIGNSIDALAAEIYPDIRSQLPSPSMLLERAILAPKHDRVREINEKLLDALLGPEHVCLGIDTAVESDGRLAYPPEFLHSVHMPTLPPHKLRLKVGCPVILLRNLDPAMGLCNGTRMWVVNVQRRLLQCKILGGAHDGEFVNLPRIPLKSPASTDGLEFTRHQFPVRLAFAMTINKSQGQSLARVGLVLDPEVFSHGQLYVALSRVTSPVGIRMVVPDTERARRAGLIKNVVWREVFR